MQQALLAGLTSHKQAAGAQVYKATARWTMNSPPSVYDGLAVMLDLGKRTLDAKGRSKMMIRQFRSGRRKLLLVFAGGVVYAAAAFGQKVQTEFDGGTDFSKFKTFALQPGHIRSNNPSLNNDLIRKKLDADVERCLEAKGLTKATSGQPDLRVRYTLGTPRRVETEVYPAGWRGWGSRVVKVPYTEGTLIIDLRNPATQSLIWRCIARDDQNDPSKIESKLDAMVKKAFDKYPPKERK